MRPALEISKLRAAAGRRRRRFGAKYTGEACRWSGVTSDCTRWSRRRALALTILIGWGSGLAALLLYLGQACPVSGPPLTPEEARGWTLRYVLSPLGSTGEALAGRLAERGRLPDLGQQVALVVRTPWTRRLAAAGWAATECVARDLAGPIPRLEILNRQGSVVWSGKLPADELQVPGAVILDQALVARVARGQPTPRLVPVGCAPRI